MSKTWYDKFFFSDMHTETSAIASAHVHGNSPDTSNLSQPVSSRRHSPSISTVTSPGTVAGDDNRTDITENAHPLLFFFDIETTGLSIYVDHIVEIAAKVVGVPWSTVTQQSYSSLIHTPKNIPYKGMFRHVPEWAFSMQYTCINSY